MTGLTFGLGGGGGEGAWEECRCWGGASVVVGEGGRRVLRVVLLRRGASGLVLLLLRDARVRRARVSAMVGGCVAMVGVEGTLHGTTTLKSGSAFVQVCTGGKLYLKA